MFRDVARLTVIQTHLLRSRAKVSNTGTCSRCLASHHTSEATNEVEIEAARKWLANLNAETIRSNAKCDISFSRSSGPGGQNVNKVSSKATLRIPSSSLLPLLPKILRPFVLESRYFAPKSGDIVIQADESRKQNENVNVCFRRLHELLVQAGRYAVPGETSIEQRRHVEDLQKAEAASRRRLKEYQSKKKSARKGGRGDGD